MMNEESYRLPPPARLHHAPRLRTLRLLLLLRLCVFSSCKPPGGSPAPVECSGARKPSERFQDAKAQRRKENHVSSARLFAFDPLEGRLRALLDPLRQVP